MVVRVMLLQSMLALARNFQIGGTEKLLLLPLSQAAMLAPSRGGFSLRSTYL